MAWIGGTKILEIFVRENYIKINCKFLPDILPEYYSPELPFPE
jgi:hypothetical protein